MQKMKKVEKGFTLVELLVVIAVLAVVSVAVVLVMNPAQILAEGRDGTRLADMTSLQQALTMVLTNDASTALCQATDQSIALGGAFTGGTGAACGAQSSGGAVTGYGNPSSPRSSDGTGWIRAALNSGVASFSTLPVDPSNGVTYYYRYGAENPLIGQKFFELNAKLESIKYAPKMLNTNDGGTSDLWYEIGTKLSIQGA